ncbi:hypothetical protein B0I35DRAFT_134689 [Stachybotrys elegans]|uniref:ATP-dependent DNA helicase n=1 Tax=Stachybotrys elegans TaxID=80388 RepID=A0A8K0WV86_9HYPO|nr:hypothetical protein B0I35DRAFT_134689 [Stachybotrys elegans]
MRTATIRLPFRSSPTRRNISQRAAQLIDAYALSQPAQTHTPTDGMLGRANKEFKANAPAQRNPLAKQLFPSSSPSAPSNVDIRDQFKKTGPAATAAASVAVSARNAEQHLHRPLDNRATNTLASASRAARSGNGSLASLYEKTASAQSKTTTIDLTSSHATDNHSDPFDFDDDFDDPEIDELLSAPHPQMSVAPVKENIPPPPFSSAPLPWSSSPPSHFQAPRPNPPQPAVASVANSLKRNSEGENTLEPSQKKPKKRVLPASWSAAPEPVVETSTSIARTPSSKPKNFWEQTASAVKEQKKQHKTQRQTSNAEAAPALSKEEMDLVNAHAAAKSVAISLSPEQEHVKNLVVKKSQSVFFTGPAGTGKSVLMRAIIKDLKDKYAKNPERVAVTASTGLAACNIGGITLHSFSGTYMSRILAS